MNYIIPSPQTKEIDIEAIRARLSEGIESCLPDDRCIAWLVILGLYPKNSSEWNRKIIKYKEEYEGYIKDMGLDDWHNKELPNYFSEHEFGLQKNSTMVLIHGDLIRTGRHIFFLSPLSVNNLSERNSSDAYFLYSQHMRRMERILYVIAGLNPELEYMQGFNELLQPFYYTLSSAGHLFDSNYLTIECLSFNMLLQLINSSDLRRFFQTNKSTEKIVSLLSVFDQHLEIHLPSVHHKLKELGIQPVHYCYRWFCLLFAQEFSMPDLVGIWDLLISHFDDMVDFAFFLGLGFMNEMKEEIINGDYHIVLQRIQNLNTGYIKSAVLYANKIWKNRK